MSHEMPIAGAEAVVLAERNMTGSVKRAAGHPAGVARAGHAQKDRIGNWEVPRLAAGWYAVRIGKAQSRSR